MSGNPDTALLPSTTQNGGDSQLRLRPSGRSSGYHIERGEIGCEGEIMLASSLVHALLVYVAGWTA